ncbi:MAG TPA: hypothetical protein DEB39_17110 [Planctomycetaceae bacterium]|nr:hypothetical protein [Planctomycetaceae bacterium]
MDGVLHEKMRKNEKSRRPPVFWGGFYTEAGSVFRPIRQLTFDSVVSMGRLPGNRLREISTAFGISIRSQRNRGRCAVDLPFF